MILENSQDIKQTAGQLFRVAQVPLALGLSSSEVTRLQHFLSYWVVDSAGSLIPTGDNAQDLGSASNQIRDSFIDPS